VGSTIIDMPDGSKKIVQADMVKKVEKAFGDRVANVKEAITPMAQGTIIERPKENESKLKSEDQQQYTKGVGMLLYLVKHSRPDLSNAVRELSK
jgi:hypothetical protein